MKNAMQLKAIIKNLAKEKHISAQLVMQNFMLERLLERISNRRMRNTLTERRLSSNFQKLLYKSTEANIILLFLDIEVPKRKPRFHICPKITTIIYPKTSKPFTNADYSPPSPTCFFCWCCGMLSPFPCCFPPHTFPRRNP